MERERSPRNLGPPLPERTRFNWAAFIQQQVQTIFQAAVPHIVQQNSERKSIAPPLINSPANMQAIDQASQGVSRYHDEDAHNKE